LILTHGYSVSALVKNSKHMSSVAEIIHPLSLPLSLSAEVFLYVTSY
jgi:hypothetical protein